MRLHLLKRNFALGLLLVSSFPTLLPGQSVRAIPNPDKAAQHQHPQPAAGQSLREPLKPYTLPQSPEIGPRLGLAELERMALEGNPTLAQAAAEIKAAEGKKEQAGVYPNPIIGATGDENTPGPVIRGGEFGFFVEQRFVTAGKLGKSRNVAEQERLRAEATAQAQKYRVLNSVRTLYYEALGAERRVQVQTQLAELSRRAVQISGELVNVGAADRPDLLESEIEAERAEVNLVMARTTHARVWRELSAVVANPTLQPTPLEGNLEAIPRLELEAAISRLFGESPEIRNAEVAVAREQAALHRAKVEKIPDILARGGLRNNRELLEAGGRPVGLEGFFDVGVEIPFFNRNHGNVAAAQANLDRAERDVQRVRLSLRIRMARVYKDYQDASIMVDRYRTQMIPRAQRAYELYLNNFRQMAAAYPQVLIAQRNLFQLQQDYINALVNAWRNVVEIEGLLLKGGLEAPEIGGKDRLMPDTGETSNGEY
jgi:cobalt-zinc-cadmium efflux system outer membrane protein